MKMEILKDLRVAKFLLAGFMAVSTVGFMASCSDDDDDDQPVLVEHIITGVVTLDEDPLEGIEIVIESKSLAKNDTVTTDKDGKYSFKPYKVEEGTDKVTYTVSVVDEEELYVEASEEVDFTKEEVKDGKVTKEVNFELELADNGDEDDNEGEE
ncbi:MAG: Ig-like domain-containing protein [Bacteroides sp.]|nr:Ig-like domain-containing protein [Bacteroides sp.]